MTDRDTVRLLQTKNNFSQIELKNLIKKYIFEREIGVQLREITYYRAIIKVLDSYYAIEYSINSDNGDVLYDEKLYEVIYLHNTDTKGYTKWIEKYLKY